MANGNSIIVSSFPQGNFREFKKKTGETIYPGMIVQEDISVALVGGRNTAKIYSRSADGEQPAGAFWVVTERLQAMCGATMTTAIPEGDSMLCYSPLPGDELNLVIANLAGTGDDHTKGEILMVDTGTGKMIATTGTPETESAVLKETITDPTSDTWAWCTWSGV